MHFFVKLLFFYFFGFEEIFCSNFNRVKLSDVETLVLNKGEYTTARRTQSILQLHCLGGTAGCSYAPQTVKCYNRGLDGFDIQWECIGDLDKNLEFGLLRMSCEGFDFAKDPYILDGSCGLDYTIEIKSLTNYDNYFKNYYETSQLGNFLTLLIMAIIVLSVYKTCNKYYETRHRSYIPIQRGDINDFTNTYDYTQYPPAPPPYISDNENGPNVETNEINGALNTMINNRTAETIAVDSTRSGFETPPPEYEEDLKTQK